MKTVIFLYNELLDASYQKKLNIPLEFISFAYIEGVMMYSVNEKVAVIKENTLRRSTKFNRVYGALYVLDSSEKFLRVLDATMICSKGLLGLNHKMDTHHREYVQATPIHFKSVEQFLKLKYNEGEPIRVVTHLANVENKLIKSKVTNTTDNRVTYGFDINNFINLVIEEKIL